jgi:hypothetical protein
VTNPEKLPANGDHYAIVIGIDKYMSLPPLRSAVADATRFAEWLLRVGRVPADNIHLIKSPPKLPPDDDLVSPLHTHITRELQRLGVFRALEGQTPAERRLGRRLYFYFSGHGIGPTPSEVGMLMANATKMFVNRNIGLEPYRMLFLNSGLFDEVFYILDCCRDDVRSAQITPPEFQLPPPGPGQALPAVKDFVLLAAGWGDKAFEADQEFQTAMRAVSAPRRSGLLTEALLEGLGLDGPPKAADALGRVTSTSILAHLEARVPELARNAGTSQVPRGDGHGAVKPMIFATFPLDPASAITLRITVTVPQAQDGILYLVQRPDRQTALEVNRRDPTMVPPDETWEVKVRPGQRYILQHEGGLERPIDLLNAVPGSAIEIRFPF